MTKVLFWISLAACTYLALTPDTPEVVESVSDVTLHGVAFTYLTITLFLAHYSAPWRAPQRSSGEAGHGLVVVLAWVGFWMALYGGLLELAQSFTATRSAELKDMLVDLLGIAVGLAICAVLVGLQRSRKRSRAIR